MVMNNEIQDKALIQVSIRPRVEINIGSRPE